MMATTPPTTLEPRVRFWRPTGELLWSSACDAPELCEEARAALAELVDSGQWVYTTVDFGPINTPNAWRRRWGGRFRLNPATGELEHRPNTEFLEAILAAPNPEFSPPVDDEAVTDA
jgi:hypothetical protein